MPVQSSTYTHKVEIRRPLPIPTFDEFIGLSKLLESALRSSPGALDALQGARRHFGWNLLVNVTKPRATVLENHFAVRDSCLYACSAVQICTCCQHEQSIDTVSLVRSKRCGDCQSLQLSSCGLLPLTVRCCCV